MALYTREDPRGVDLKIDVLQKHLFGLDIFSDWVDFWDCHDRAILVPKGLNERNLKAMTYRDGEYKDVYMQDGQGLISFFTAPKQRPVTDDLLVDTTVSMFIQGDMSKLFPETSHKADEEVVNRFLQAFHRQPEFRVSNVIQTVEEVYRGLDVTKLILDDLSRWFVLRLELEVSYEAECF